MEKRGNEIFMQSPGRRYLAMLASCCAEQPTVSMGGSVPRYRARNKGGCIGAESKNSYSNQERGPTFRVIGEAQILCFAGLYTGGSDGQTRDQVRASFFLFSLSAGVTKTGGWTTSLVTVVIEWLSNIAFRLRLIWLQILVAIDSESCQTSFQSFFAPQSEVAVLFNSSSEVAVLFNSNLSRRSFLRQVVHLYLLYCTGFDSEHTVLFL